MENIESQLQGQEKAQDEGASTFRTCFNGINTLLGVGILAVPYALSHGGWVSFSFLFLMATASWYTGLLVQRCMQVNAAANLIRSYPDIGQKAFGNKGRIIVSILLYLDLYLVAVEFLILGGDSFERLFPHTKLNIGALTLKGQKGFVILTAILVLPTTWLRSLGLVAYVSAGGIVASLVVVGCVFWAGAVDGLGFQNHEGEVFKFGGLPNTVSLFMFCYGGHAVFPTLCNSMKERNNFSKVLFVCFLTSTICYGSMAILGYLIFGSHLDSQVTLNLPREKISAKVAICTTLISSLCKYPVITSPIFCGIEDKFKFSRKRNVSILMRTLLVLSTLCIALFVPFFGYIMSFIGAFPGLSLSLLLPCSCYLKMNSATRKFGLELIVNIGILVMGASIAMLGTYTSLKQIVSHL